MLGKKVALILLKRWIGRRVIATIGPDLPPPPFIVTANHTSFFDHFVIAYWLLSNGMPYPRFLSKSELFERPFSAWFNSLGGGIPVARQGVDTEAFGKAQAVLDAGGVFILYAEGTRSRDGWLRAPRRGIATLATQAGVPVVPVGLIGTNQVLPIGARWPKRARRIVINSSAPIAPPDHDRQAQQDFVREAFQIIAGLTGQWPGFVEEPRFTDRGEVPQLYGVAATAHKLVEQAFEVGGDQANELFAEAVRTCGWSRRPEVVLERGRALGQLARTGRNPVVQLARAIRSREAIWFAVRRLPRNPLAWHVWAAMLEQLPRWLGGDRAAAQTGHRVALALAPTLPRTLVHVAQMQRAGGRTGEAIRWLDRAVAGPDHGDVARHQRARALRHEWHAEDSIHESAIAAGGHN
jgi:1-acyl-sn-glycerol-3-phosphate acyltransferase